MRKKWKQQLFVYLLIMSLIITLGMNVQPLHEIKQTATPIPATALLPVPLPIAIPTQSPNPEPVPEPVPPAQIPVTVNVSEEAEATTPSQVPNPEENIEEINIEVVEEPVHTYEVTAYYLNVRTEPSAKSKIIKVVEKDTLLQVTAQTDNGWLELKGEGYVHGYYAKKQKDEVSILSFSGSNDDAAVSIKSTADTAVAAAVPQVKKILPVEEPSEPTSIVASDSGLTVEHITQIFDGTELAGHQLEEAILEIEDEYGINAYFTIAVMKLESGNGKSRLAKKKNNLFGLNAIDGDKYNKAFSFETKADSVRRFGQLLSKHYVGKGLETIEKVARKYCPANSNWSSLVKKIMKSDYRKL
ncbi:glucosaminidase domain-containing protein [Paenibacillus harenae]|uniref:glucosaminidase domain-containing protein n=1 Tax=Paenibacillus harenae TaxID=306543 RepID=UPI0003FE72BD|nr:glucosaminidase domain-containing protein [Paenibacillus harenae]